MAKHRGTDIVAAAQTRRPPGTSSDQSGAFADAGVDEALDLVELHLADDGPQHGVLRLRMTDFELLSGLLRNPVSFLDPIGGDKHACRGIA